MFEDASMNPDSETHSAFPRIRAPPNVPEFASGARSEPLVMEGCLSSMLLRVGNWRLRRIWII